MADQRITIKFQAKGNEALETAIKNLDVATKRLSGKTSLYEKEGKKVGMRNRLLSNSFATLRSHMLLVSFAMSLGIRQLGQFAKEAAKVQDMSKAFSSLQGGTDKATVAIEKLRLATDNTMTQFDLFKQANNAMILGVTKNSDEMAEMFDMAQRLGRALGLDTKTAVESLITGIGRQSRLMLDNIGIVVKADEAYEKMALQLGTTVDSLTDAEKKQAFMNATMEAAREKLTNLPEETASASESFEKFRTTVNKLTIDSGNLVLMGLQPVMDWFTRVVDENTADDIGAVFESKNIDIMKLALEKLRKEQADLVSSNTQVLNSGNVIKTMTDEETAQFLALGIQIDNLGQAISALLLAPPDEGEGSLKKALVDINRLLDEQAKKAKLAGDAFAFAGVKAGSSYKHAGRAAEEAAQQALIAEAQKFMASYISSIMAGLDFPFNIAAVAGGGAFAGNLFQQLVSQAKTFKFEQGGLVGGRRHSQGGTMIEAEQGEFVMSRSAVEAVGIENMNRINQGGSAVTVNVSGNVMTQDFVEGDLAEAIRNAARRGTDFGVS